MNTANQNFSPTLPDTGVVSIPDRDYYLEEGRGWFEYHGLVVRIFHNEKQNGMEVLVFRVGDEDADPVSQDFIPYEEQ